MEDLLMIALPVAVLLNIYATIRLWLRHEFGKGQKFFQTIFIWLIPIVGAMTILAFIRDDTTPKGPDNPNDGQGVDGMPGGVQ